MYLYKWLNVLLIILSCNILIAPQTALSKEEFRVIENKAFKEGEKLVFDLDYGFVTGGVVVMEIPRIKKISGRNAYHRNFEVNSVPSFDMFYKVSDRYESYLDVEGLFPWRFEAYKRRWIYT